MAITDFFDHKCDIYHVVNTEKSPGFGLPAAPAFSYPDAPDLAGVPCHFGVRSLSLSFFRDRPYTDMTGGDKIGLPAGTDLRLNDRVVDLATGVVYTAGVPRDIRGHHIAAQLYRAEEQRAL